MKLKLPTTSRWLKVLDDENSPCLFLAVKERPELKGPRVTCRHGRTLHINLARQVLELPSLNIEELASLEALRKREHYGKELETT